MYYGESTFQAFLSEALIKGAALYYNMQKLQYLQELGFNYYPNEYGGSYSPIICYFLLMIFIF
ncbi:MAG: hypothetical protein ACTSRP_03445 [Candidatus Helarchaeota archaeon]